MPACAAALMAAKTSRGGARSRSTRGVQFGTRRVFRLGSQGRKGGEFVTHPCVVRGPSWAMVREGSPCSAKPASVLPLFSIRTRRDWGIGQITDLPACAAWMRRAGQRLLQILPPHELPPGRRAPTARSPPSGSIPSTSTSKPWRTSTRRRSPTRSATRARAPSRACRAAPRVDYADRARAEDPRPPAPRSSGSTSASGRARRRGPAASPLSSSSERAWLDDLALYATLRESHGGWGWTTWPEARARAATRRRSTRRARARAARILEVGVRAVDAARAVGRGARARCASSASS